MQSGPALLGRVRIGPPLDKILRQREVAVHHRQDQGAGAHGRVSTGAIHVVLGGDRPDRVVHVGAGFEECAHRLGLARADGVQQRRPAGGRALVDVRAQLDQCVDGGRMVLCRGPVQRRLAAPALPCTQVGAAGQQQSQYVDVAGARRRHQYRLAFRQRGVRVGAGVEERLDDRSVPAASGQNEGRHAVAVGCFRPRARFQEESRRLEVAPVRRPVQGGRPVGLGNVDVYPALQQSANGVGVRCPGRLDQGQVARGSRGCAGDRHSEDRPCGDQHGTPRPRRRSVLYPHFGFSPISCDSRCSA